MPSQNQNGENGSIGSRQGPRRLKSLSEAIDSIGNSFHNIYEKHVHIKKPKTKLGKTKSSIDLSLPPEELEEPREKIKGTFRSKSVYSKKTQSKNSYAAKPTSPSISVTSAPPTSVETNHTKLLLSASLPCPLEVELPVSPVVNGEQQILYRTGDERRSSLYKQPTVRRNSMMWVDFITEPGVVVNGDGSVDDEDSFDTSFDEDELADELRELNPVAVSPGEFLEKKACFYSPTNGDRNSDAEEEDIGQQAEECDGKNKFIKRQSTGDFESPRNNFYRKVRKDSALSIRSNSSRGARSPMPEGSIRHRNVDDLIFDMFREKDEEVAIIGTFLAALAKTGLRKDDPRLAEMFENLRRVHKDQESNFPGRIGSIETLRVDRETFKVIITDNIVLISKAFRQQFVIPEFQTFCAHLEEMYWRCRDVKGGKVAGYIPQLARVDPNLWGVSICTIDGQRYAIGDTMMPFTIQSCSKPLTYAIALNELGEDTVHQYVGQEPSGRMFNELVLDYNKKPHNPMVNAGAIIVCSLLKSMVRPEMSLAEKFDYTHNYFKKLCGGEYVGFNNAVFLSERDAADRNYALGFYMRENKCFPEGSSLQECMDYYFQICSMECNCEAMSVMAATLANGGICPVSGEKVLKSDSVRDVLSLMHSCGMYDYSGQFAFKVGLPAKSGVSGAIMIVVPNVFGMAVWSPPLDVLGNSVRGVALAQEIVSVFNFHKYDNLRHASDKLDPRRHRYETKGLNIVNLLFSAASGDVTSMRRHHLSGMDMNASDYDGRTALHLAAAEGHLECVQYLLRHCHVSHSPLDRWGHLPVDDASKFGHEEVLEFLKKWAADNPD